MNDLFIWRLISWTFVKTEEKEKGRFHKDEDDSLS